MEDHMKPGKPAKEVSAALRKSQAGSGGNNDPGVSASKSRVGTNRGTVSGSNPKHSPNVGVRK